MTKTKMVNGEIINLTAEEEAICNARSAAWNDGKFDRAISELREQRNHLLAETDFYALQDVSMTQDMTNYRQALRDLPEGLTTVEDVEAVTWPTKP